MKSILSKILAIIASIIGVFFYGKQQGRKSEKSKQDAMLLDDIVSAKMVDADIDNLSDDDVDARLRVFARRSKK